MSDSKKYKVVVDGFETKEEAEEFVIWLSEQGEQDMHIWFSEAERVKNTYVVDVSSTFSKIGKLRELDEESFGCKMSPDPK